MAQFLANIAGILEIGAIAAGFLLLYRARSDASAGLLRAAGMVLVAGGLVIGASTAWYWFSYRDQGQFAMAHMMTPGMMMPMADSMYRGMPSMPMWTGDSATKMGPGGRMMTPRMNPAVPPSDSK